MKRTIHSPVGLEFNQDEFFVEINTGEAAASRGKVMAILTGTEIASIVAPLGTNTRLAEKVRTPTAADLKYGILVVLNKSAVAGDVVKAHFSGDGIYIIAGEIIASGDPFEIKTDGKAWNAATAGSKVVGIAMDDAVADGLFLAYFSGMASLGTV